MRVGFPRIGDEATDVLCEFLIALGLDVVRPPPVTDRTIRLGVAHSPDMMCFPYKVTLGSLIEVADRGAEVLLQLNSGSQGHCRQKQYWRLQAFKLKRLGYSCRVVGVTPTGLVREMSRLSGTPRWRTARIAARLLKRLGEEESPGRWSSVRPNIGVIGEAYCCVEKGANRNLYDLIARHGGNLVRSVTICDYMSDQWSWRWWRDRYAKVAARYFEGQMAGHAMENIASLLRLIDQGIDGVIHVMPLTCMPECVIEDYVDAICQDASVPLLRLPLDETNSPANVETRVETFVKLIARSQACFTSVLTAEASA